MPYRVAHATRGRLRVRYPVSWLRRRRSALEPRLRALRGVRAVLGSSVTGSILIDYDPFVLAERKLIDQVARLTASFDGAPARERRRAQAHSPVMEPGTPLLPLLGAGAVLTAALLSAPGPLLGALVLASDTPALARALGALGARRLDGDVLEVSGLALLLARGNYGAAALLSCLRSLGGVIVAKSVVTTRGSLGELVAAPDETVERLEGGRSRSVRLGEIVPGDLVGIDPGGRVPADGTVVHGEALVNQQTMTGEAMPVERRTGDPVFAATTVEHGRIEVRVDRVGPDTAVGRIVAAVEAAAGTKSEIQKFAERLADRDVGRTLALAGLGAGVARSLDAATAIMLADYGLAARVGIPTAILTSIKRASREGILIKGPTALENLARVNTVVFDKTGTLTSGAPRVARTISYRRGLSERELLRLIAAAEQGFGHPVARAVARVARELGIEPSAATSRAESIGLGVAVRIDGEQVLVGSRRFMESHHVALASASAAEAAAHAAGAAVTFVAVDGRLAGLLVLEDELRPEAPAAVRALRARRMRNVIMLSGDHPEPTRVIAETLGLKHRYADLLPEDKARLIRRLKGEGRVVAMVGDGVNDALALREADVGIAVPGGAALALEVADVVLLRGGLDRVVRALDLSAGAITAVRRTIEVASRANLAVVGLASFGLARPVTSILLSHGSTVAAALAVAAGGAAWLPAPGAKPALDG